MYSIRAGVPIAGYMQEITIVLQNADIHLPISTSSQVVDRLSLPTIRSAIWMFNLETPFCEKEELVNYVYMTESIRNTKYVRCQLKLPPQMRSCD